jgi:MFS family permease
MVVVTTQDSPVLLGLAFGTIGLSVGAAFSASQFYSFFQEDRKGERGARNEMIIGMGMVSGPFVGGLLAQNIGLRMPYVLCCVVLVVAMLMEFRLYRKHTSAAKAVL